MPAASRPSKSRRPSGMRPGGASTSRSTGLAAASRSTSPSIHSASTDGMSSWGSPSQEERGHPDRQPRHPGVGGGGVEGQAVELQRLSEGTGERPSPTASESSDFLEVKAILTQ